MRALKPVAFLAFTAVVGLGLPGDVISSFQVGSGLGVIPWGGPYRDGPGGNVFVVWQRSVMPATVYISEFTVAGSLIRSVTIPGIDSCLDVDATHFGQGYIGLGVKPPRELRIYETGGLTCVASWPLLDYSYCNFFWDGEYYHFGYNYGWHQRRFYTYTSTGSFVGTMKYGGYPGRVPMGGAGFTNNFGGAVGSFTVIATNFSPYGTFVINHVTGSLVSCWPNPGHWPNYGASCGPGFPASYGTTFWGSYAEPDSRSNVWVYQVDLGNSVSVSPASLGRIKALYR